MAMKSGPKIVLQALLIFSIVGAVGVGLNKVLDARKTSTPTVATESSITVTPPVRTEVVEAPKTAPAEQAQPETKSSNVTSGDAGMSAVLKAGQK